jgi:type II secretory pathway pseudopilin PulG
MTENSKFKIQNSKFWKRCKCIINFDIYISHFPFRHISGFTLLETVVALGVIMAAIVGPYALATRGVSSGIANKNRLTALYLVEEGVELVRYIRENNVLVGIPWDGEDGVENGNEIRAGTWQIDAANGVLSVYSGAPLRHDSNSGLYGYGSGDASLFRRTITIENPPSSPTSGIPAAAQIKVRSSVSWTEGTQTRSVSLEEMLYNWQ